MIELIDSLFFIAAKLLLGLATAGLGFVILRLSREQRKHKRQPAAPARDANETGDE